MARELKRERALSSSDETAGSAAHVDPPSPAASSLEVSSHPGSSLDGSARPASSLDGSSRTTASLDPSSRAPSSRPAASRAAPSRWFEALDPNAPTQTPPRPSALAALPLLLAAPLTFLLLPGGILRGLAAAALVLAALIVIARARRPAALPSSPKRGLSLRGDHLLFRGNGRSALLLTLTSPFGVTVLATPKRDRALAVLSSASGTFYVGARFDAYARRAASRLFEQGTTVGSEDDGLAAVGPDGEPLLLAPDDLAALVDALVARSPACTDRFVLTDARGAALTLDDRSLHLNDRQIDLATPLEWRAIVFQEAFGQAVAVYQGTWIRQGGTNLCLVCLLPSLGPTAGPDLDLKSLDRATLRDLRLMRATPEEPPPPDQRVAIERLFMQPLRSALDRAPHPAQRSTRARA